MPPQVEARVLVVGLGPAGGEMTPRESLQPLVEEELAFVRTLRHPAAKDADRARRAAGRASLVSFDSLYEGAESYEELYRSIVEELVAASSGSNQRVVYAVPGSPLVAERTVSLLRVDPRVRLDMVPASSFLDLAWERLGIDPVADGVRLVDAEDFAFEAAGERGPMLVAQCYSRAVLSGVKLALTDEPPLEPSGADPTVTILHHLGLEDEQVLEVPWWEMDRAVEADHLTSLWIPRLAAPLAYEVARLAELARVLRERCPWDREQTHASLGRHLLEETYEVLDAIDVLCRSGPEPPAEAVGHLEEELGDLLFQVVFHATLGAEEGWFDLASVARGTHEKLIGRHPHVFGSVVATTKEEVAANWEVIKRAEKNRSSVTEGIPIDLPALALASKLLRKASSLGSETSSAGEPEHGSEARSGELGELADELSSLARTLAASCLKPGQPGRTGEYSDHDQERLLGELLFAATRMSCSLGLDAEAALRSRALEFRELLASRG